MIRALKNIIILATLISTQQTRGGSTNQSCPTDRPDYFCITPSMAPDSEIQILDFYKIPVQIISLFQMELSLKKVQVNLDAQWESPYFGAGSALNENQFRLMILGGTTRVPGLTKDAYAAIVCHELGHLLGGEPRQTISGAEWSSAEGEADFFAAQVCLTRYYLVHGVQVEELPSKIETAGFEMFTAFQKFDSSGFSSELVRYKAEKSETSQTLLNTYPSLQCRYENFREQKNQRPTCWWHP